MGWDVQGYYTNPGDTASSWHVECSGDSLDEVEAFGGKNPLPQEEADSLQIYYGNRELEVFRGFSSLVDLDLLKKQLQNFDNYLVYADKWNPIKKSFRCEQINFISLGNMSVFHEKIDGDLSLIKRGLTDLLERIESGSIYNQASFQALQAYILSLSEDEKR